MTDIPDDIPRQTESEFGTVESPINYSVFEIRLPHDLHDRLQNHTDVDWNEVAVQEIEDTLSRLETTD